MTTAVKNLFGNGDIEQQRAEARNAQAQQQALIGEEKEKLRQVEEGQKRARRGGRGLLAYIDDNQGGALLGG